VASRDAEKTAGEQREHLDRTLDAQTQQLDRTLNEQRTRTLNERFAAAAGQLGSDKPPEVRLAGVYAMAGLADDWAETRQVWVDVLCGYLRMPYKPDPGADAPEPERLAFQANREVRHTVIRVIAAHLQDDAAVSWHARNLDFTGVVFDGGTFAGAHLSGGTFHFDYAKFSSGIVEFYCADFFDGRILFNFAKFSGGIVSFDRSLFSGGAVDFQRAELSGGTVDFSNVKFSGTEVDFSASKMWSCPPKFPWTGAPPPGVELPP
jgi:hypothetical protein